MHLPLLSALDPYMHGRAVARGDKTKPAEFESFVVESVSEKSASERRFHGGGRDEDAPEEDAQSFDQKAFEQTLNDADGGAPMPEDALDAYDLCALLQAAAGSKG